MCKKCADTGYLQGVENNITGEVIRVDSSLSPGEVAKLYKYPTWSHIVQPCKCRVDDQLQEMIAATAKKIPNDVKNQTLANYQGLDHAADALYCAESIIKGDKIALNGNVKPGFMLLGSTGTGKSSLLYLVYKHFAGTGTPIAWVNYNDLINRIRETYIDNYQGPSIGGICQPLGRVPVLVLDDIGSETRQTVMAEDAIEAMRLIFEARYNAVLPTFGSSNLLTPERLKEQFGSRAYSRMSGNMHFIEMTGLDLREKV